MNYQVFNTSISYKLAVVIPSWNASAYISEMLDSILANTFRDYNVFVIDDKSTDNTGNIVLEYQKKDKRIHFIERCREPKGAQTCRNIGFEQTEGAEYVIWFDADDYITPFCFAQRVSYMEKHQDLDFGVFPARTISKENDNIENSTIFGVNYQSDSLESMLNWSLPMVGWTNVYRRKSLENVTPLWDESILSLQDSDFNISNIVRGLKYDFAIKEGAKVDYYYRVDNNGIANKIRTEAHYLSHLYLIEKTLNAVSRSRGAASTFMLQANVVNYFDIFGRRKRYYCRLLKIKWIQQHPTFGIKILIFLLSNFRWKERLFSKELSYSRKMLAGWQPYCHDVIEKNCVVTKSF